MSKTKVLTGLELAVSLCDEHTNDWNGGDEPEKIATSRFAVVIEREDEGWVHAVESWEEVAGLHMDCLRVDCYVEWVSGVWDVATGENVTPRQEIVSRIKAPNGEVFESKSGMLD